MLNELFPFALKHYTKNWYDDLKDKKRHALEGKKGIERHIAMRQFRKDPQIRQERIGNLKAIKNDNDVLKYHISAAMTSKDPNGNKVYVGPTGFNSNGVGIRIKKNPTWGREMIGTTRFGKNYY